MKKLILSMLLCFGVGLAMQASPSQVCGDDNAGNGKRVQKVTHVLNKAKTTDRHASDAVKQDARKSSAPSQRSPKQGADKQNPVNLCQLDVYQGDSERVKKEPLPPPGSYHPNGGILPGLLDKLRDLLM